MVYVSVCEHVCVSLCALWVCACVCVRIWEYEHVLWVCVYECVSVYISMDLCVNVCGISKCVWMCVFGMFVYEWGCPCLHIETNLLLADLLWLTDCFETGLPLSWWLGSPSNPPVSVPHSAGVTGKCGHSGSSSGWWGVGFMFSWLAHQALQRWAIATLKTPLNIISTTNSTCKRMHYEVTKKKTIPSWKINFVSFGLLTESFPHLSRCWELQFFSSYPEKCPPYSLPVVCWHQNQWPWLCSAISLKVNRERFLLLQLFISTSYCGLHLLLHTTRLSGSPGWPVISAGRDWGTRKCCKFKASLA